MRDTAIRYKSEFKKIELMLPKIKNLGFDVSEYDKILTEINNKVSKNVKDVYLSDKLVQGRLDQIYLDGVKELNKLEFLLEQYSVYFKVFNSCNYIDIKLKDNNISQEQLEKLVSQMIYNLSAINKSNTIDYDREKHVVEKVYDTAYNVIKLELVMTGDSQLYKYASSMDMNIYFFSELILNDVLKLDLSIEKYQSIKAKIYNLNSLGINNNYFDLELIKLLLVHENNSNLKNSIIKRLEELEELIISGGNEIVSTYNDANNSNKKVIDSRKKLVKLKKDVLKRLVSVLLTSTIIVTGGFGVRKIAREECTKNSFLKTTETYSSLNDTTTYSEPKIVFYTNPIEKVYIREYEPWVNNGGNITRNYKKYNVSHIDLDTARDYYDYGVENYGVDYTEHNERYTTYQRSDIIFSQDNYIEVEMNEYEDNGLALDRDSYIFGLFIGTLLYIAVLLIALMIKASAMDLDNLFEVVELLETFKDFMLGKQKYDVDYNKLQDKVNELMKIINSNEEYRNKFRELYEENKFLLDNPEELYRRIDELEQLDSIEEAKKLVRENTRKR